MTFQEPPGFCMIQMVRTGVQTVPADKQVRLPAKAETRKTATIETITRAARTGIIGNGKIVVYSLEQVVSSRTGETGVDAL